MLLVDGARVEKSRFSLRLIPSYSQVSTFLILFMCPMKVGGGKEVVEGL